MQCLLLDTCFKKCLPIDNNPIESPTILQKSCFYRCSVKFSEAQKFTANYIKFQNYEIHKYHEMNANSDKPLLDKLHAIYQQHYGNTN